MLSENWKPHKNVYYIPKLLPILLILFKQIFKLIIFAKLFNINVLVMNKTIYKIWHQYNSIWYTGILSLSTFYLPWVGQNVQVLAHAVADRIKNVLYSLLVGTPRSNV